MDSLMGLAHGGEDVRKDVCVQVGQGLCVDHQPTFQIYPVSSCLVFVPEA
jgi:hypothetical protein